MKSTPQQTPDAPCAFADDRRLVDRYLAGDRAAGDELAAMLAPVIGSVVARVFGPARAGERDDARQSIWLRVFERLHTWRARCPLRGWVMVVATRRALDIRHKRWPILLSGDVLASLPATRPQSDAVLGECIRSTMDQFPGPWQQVLELDLDDVNHGDIASRMGRSRRTIQYWLENMRNALLQCVEG